MTNPYERPHLTRRQKKIMWAFLVAVFAVSLFMFQAVTWTAKTKEDADKNKKPTEDSLTPGSDPDPSQVK